MERSAMSRRLLIILMIGPILMIAFLSVWQRNGMIQVGYETEGLKKERAILLRQRKNLLAEVSRLSSIERIEQLALKAIQMKNPDPGQRIYVSLQEQ
jgi:cell division protein FtsL